MRSSLSNNEHELENTTTGHDQALNNNPASATSNQHQNLSGFSTAMSPGELQSSYPAIDPWFLYGGNIAAACEATNAVVDVHQRTRDDTKAVDDGDKQKQRANSRLTAWQSRERKRIEFEVLQERETELKSRNLELLQENQQLKMIIGSFKSSAMSTRDNSATKEQPRDRDVMRLPQKGVPTSSSQTSRQISRNFEDIHQQFGLPFQNRTPLTIPEPRGSRELMFSLEPDPMTGVASFPSTMEYSSTRDANRRMMPSSTNDEGTSLTGGTSQHVQGDMGGYSTMGLASVSGSTSGNFFYNTNDMLAPTIFAPLFRGESNQEQSAIAATANSHGNERVGQNSNRHLLFGSSLPFLSSFSGQGSGSSNFAANLSNYLTASLAEEKVDVPLFRAIRTARSSQSNHSQQPQAPKRKRSLQQGKEDEGRIPEHEDAAGSSDYTTKKNAYPRLSSTTRENVVVTESKAYPGSGIHGSELLFSGDNVDETPPFSLGDNLVASLSNSNIYNDDGDES